MRLPVKILPCAGETRRQAVAPTCILHGNSRSTPWHGNSLRSLSPAGSAMTCKMSPTICSSRHATAKDPHRRALVLDFGAQPAELAPRSARMHIHALTLRLPTTASPINCMHLCSLQHVHQHCLQKWRKIALKNPWSVGRGEGSAC